MMSYLFVSQISQIILIKWRIILWHMLTINYSYDHQATSLVFTMVFINASTWAHNRTSSLWNLSTTILSIISRAFTISARAHSIYTIASIFLRFNLTPSSQGLSTKPWKNWASFMTLFSHSVATTSAFFSSTPIPITVSWANFLTLSRCSPKYGWNFMVTW